MFYELNMCNLLIRGFCSFKHVCRKLTLAYNLGIVKKVLLFCYNYNTAILTLMLKLTCNSSITGI
jgi:hypothetical protein